MGLRCRLVHKRTEPQYISRADAMYLMILRRQIAFKVVYGNLSLYR